MVTLPPAWPTSRALFDGDVAVGHQADEGVPHLRRCPAGSDPRGRADRAEGPSDVRSVQGSSGGGTEHKIPRRRLRLGIFAQSLRRASRQPRQSDGPPGLTLLASPLASTGDRALIPRNKQTGHLREPCAGSAGGYAASVLSWCAAMCFAMYFPSRPTPPTRIEPKAYWKAARRSTARAMSR
jgi:hypothetical protein